MCIRDRIQTDESFTSSDATKGRSFFYGTRLEGYTFSTDNAGETLPKGTYVRNVIASQRDGTKLVDISFEIISLLFTRISAANVLLLSLVLQRV